MNKILIVDSTLRDGSHAVGHQLTTRNISDYSKGAEKAGIKLLIVGHGNGLGASSLHLGQSLLTDKQMLQAAKKNLRKTKLGAFLIPGFGTIKDNLNPAIECGIEALMVASHCTEANITREHIEYAVKRGIDTYGVLMMSHMLDAEGLLIQAKQMQDYGSKGIIIMDSAGTYLPKDVTNKIEPLAKNLRIPVGFHAHNNLGMAIANSLAAVQAGASIIDTTSRGMGAGAGNCQLEVIVAVLTRMGYEFDLNLNKLMDNSEKITAQMMKKPQVISSNSLATGLAGVFSGFAPHAEIAGQNFGIDPRDIIEELGHRKVVAGQEDIIVDVALSLKRKHSKRDIRDSIEALI